MHKCFSRRIHRVSWLLLFSLLGCGAPAGSAHGQPAGSAAKSAEKAPHQKAKEAPLADRIHKPVESDRSLADKLRSPRETLKTLYFAVLIYDLFPQMIEDATACLDLDALKPRPSSEDAVLLVLDLEYILQNLALPLSSVPEEGGGERFVLYDAEGFTLSLRSGADGCWRFDAATLERLPAMLRATRQRRAKKPTADTTPLVDGLTDPRATLRQFIADAVRNDFYAAARALDLSAMSNEQRRQEGPILAQQLAFVIQHRGFVFRQEVPQQPDGPLYTWHADKNGRIALDRIRQPDGKDAWLFTRQSVRNIPKMYAAVQESAADPRYVHLGLVIPAVAASTSAAVRKPPEEIPAHLSSPRALLQGFFRTMDHADANDARLADALEYLDLDNVPLADRAALGGKLAIKLEAILRRLPLDLSAIPNDWNAGPQVLGEAQGLRIEIVRQHDGGWSFSAGTIARIPEMFDKLAGTTRPEQGHGTQLDSARDTMMTFQSAVRRRHFIEAAHCLNLKDIPSSAQDELGPVLAFKLQYVLERLGHIYIQEIPDNAEGARYVLYRGELGRIILDRKADEPNKGQWLFTAETVRNIETMFRAMLGQSPAGGPEDNSELIAVPRFWETPGIWLRLHLPDWALTPLGPLDVYQWPGLLLALAASWLGAWLTMAVVTRLLAWLLHRCGSAVSSGFVVSSLRPLTALAAAWTLFVLLQELDLCVPFASTVFAAEKFLLAGLLGWLGWRLMDLSLAVYHNTELLLPHRSLSDMIVPVSMRLGKAVILLAVSIYIIYQIGEVDLLSRFLTGLGVAGLAASLSAQDALKNYFGTLLLIGERAFKIGDRISVSGKEGIVEQVGFRSTRLRTADDSLLTIPNAVIAASPIDNMGVRARMRFSMNLALASDNSLQQLMMFRDRLQEWLREQAVVVHEKIDVRVQQLDDRMGLSVNLFLTGDQSAAEQLFQKEISAEILRLAAALEVRIASPDQNALRAA
jgi:MscS family membrane protein